MEDLTLTDFFAILRRWKNVFMLTAFVMLVLSLTFAEAWSNYRATSVVQIEQPEISVNATTPAGTNPRDLMEALADQRISLIQQKVTSTASLIDIITKFDLYARARKHKPIADVAATMRKHVKVELISSTLANPAAASKVSATDLSAIAFNLSFDYSDPLLTQQVTDELTSRFLDEDLKERRTQAVETADFLAKQINVMDDYLLEQEKKIAEYQNTHGISRAGNLALNQQISANLTMNLQALDGQITTNEGNLGALRAQLANVDPYSRVIADGQVMTSPSVQLKALQAQYATLSAQYSPDHPDVIKLRHQIEALQTQVGGKSHGDSQLKAQIADVRTNLAAARKTYGPDHPDVVSLKQQLNSLENQSATARSGSLSAGGIISDADNPAYMQVAAQVRSAEEQHKALSSQRAALVEQQQSYQKAVSENPEVEKEMAALSRDYENAQMRYRELKEKKMTADMEAQMQTDRKGQRLTLIDPPEYPQDTHPFRIFLILGGVVFSLIAGFGAVILAQTFSQSVIGQNHLESIVGVAPLVTIPHIYTTEEREHFLRRKIAMLLPNIMINDHTRASET